MAHHIQSISRNQVDDVDESVECGVGRQVRVAGVGGQGRHCCQIWELCAVGQRDGWGVGCILHHPKFITREYVQRQALRLTQDP